MSQAPNDDIHEAVYEILIEEVRRVREKQAAGELDIEDVRKVQMLSATAASIGKASPPEINPAESMDAEGLLKHLKGS